MGLSGFSHSQRAGERPELFVGKRNFDQVTQGDLQGDKPRKRPIVRDVSDFGAADCVECHGGLCALFENVPNVNVRRLYGVHGMEGK